MLSVFAREVLAVTETVAKKDEQTVIEKDAPLEVTDTELDASEKHVPKVMAGVLLKVTKNVTGELAKDTSDVLSFFCEGDTGGG